MSTKIVTIPQHTLQLQTGETNVVTGRSVVEEKNTFVQLLQYITENTKHKNDTDAFLSHAIREKLDALSARPKTLELEEAEIDFLEGGIKSLRSEQGLAGSAWYYVISPLREAEHKKLKQVK